LQIPTLDFVNRLRLHRSLPLLLLHHLRHPADDGRKAQLCHRPGGVHLRGTQSLSRHHQPLPLHPEDHRIYQKLENPDVGLREKWHQRYAYVGLLILKDFHQSYLDLFYLKKFYCSCYIHYLILLKYWEKIL